ncbi:MAG: hypothetical protein ACD_63C00035G0003 [uncultured bacterium]|nr:MAG: hypothetical protein ACD_63C00035G0003 [uncultured bacterium]
MRLELFKYMFDVIIKSGKIIDGTNKKMYAGDIGIEKGKIKKIGSLSNDSADVVVDADEKFVVPGFIDIHNHSDGYWTLFNYRTCDSMVRQGVTTIIGGGSGTSLAPLANPENIYAIKRWTNIEEITVNWLTVEGLLNELEKLKISVNFGTLVGHITLKRGFVKDTVRDFTEEEARTADGMLDRAMKEGAFGLSTGLSYSHAKYAKAEEIVRLANVVSRYKGLYTNALRDEGSGLIESIKETIRIGKESNVSIEITQFKAKGKNNWKLFDEAVDLISKAHEERLKINFDLYPYSTTGTVLYTYLPDWATKGGRAKLLDRLKNPNLRPKIISEMREDEHDYENLVIAMSSNPSYVGKKVVRIGEEEKLSSEEAIVNTLIASDGKAICFDASLSENNVKNGLAHPLSMVSSDGSGYSDVYARTGNLVHPRCFGTFPRFLGKYVRGEKLMSWEEAIYKISGMQARKLGLKDRGFVQEGLAADLVVFDPEEIIDRATFENPYRYPEGIDYVFVNGEAVVSKGNHTGKMPGKMLRY